MLEVGPTKTPSVFVSAIRTVSRFMRALNIGTAPVIQSAENKNAGCHDNTRYWSDAVR